MYKTLSCVQTSLCTWRDKIPVLPSSELTIYSSPPRSQRYSLCPSAAWFPLSYQGSNRKSLRQSFNAQVHNYPIMTSAAASSSTPSSEAQQNVQVAPACKKSSHFISPEVASYFLGEYMSINKSKDRRSLPAWFHSSGRMCGSSFADGCQSSRKTENHPVRLYYLIRCLKYPSHLSCLVQTSTAPRQWLTIQGGLAQSYKNVDGRGI